MRVAFVCLVLAACGFPKPHDVGSDDAPPAGSDAAIQDAAPDAPPDAPGQCDVLTQSTMGCGSNVRCTYIDQGSGLGVACEPMGTAGHGSNCMIDPTNQLDNCMAGDVCAGGSCKTVCNSQGSDSCGSGFVCDNYARGTGTIGACDRTCDPLNDNDFDGPMNIHTKNGTVCTAAMQGCYGGPVNTPPKHTAFTCQTDINYAGQNLHNKDQCTAASGCAGSSGSPYINGCNQGYEPLLGDQTGSTTVYCAALCKPLNCYQGNCGTGASNQRGAFPHRCDPADALGNFNTAVAGEECTYWWFLEIDPNTSNLNRSPYSDTLGVCLDHSLYQYDSNSDGVADMPLPPCSTLPPGSGTGMPFGAADLGCVDSVTAGISRKLPRPLIDIRLPYHRVVAP